MTIQCETENIDILAIDKHGQYYLAITKSVIRQHFIRPSHLAECHECFYTWNDMDNIRIIKHWHNFTGNSNVQCALYYADQKYPT